MGVFESTPFAQVCFKPFGFTNKTSLRGVNFSFANEKLKSDSVLRNLVQAEGGPAFAQGERITQRTIAIFKYSLFFTRHCILAYILRPVNSFGILT